MARVWTALGKLESSLVRVAVSPGGAEEQATVPIDHAPAQPDPDRRKKRLLNPISTATMSVAREEDRRTHLLAPFQVLIGCL